MLKKKGHNVEILITSKDVLEDLLKSEDWEYTNIFPEGRKFNNLPTYFSVAINTFRTLWRLFKYTLGKRYDLFITDDLLVYIGRIKRVPSFVFTDDDLSITKQFSILLLPANHCLAPDITNLGYFNKKKIGFKSYKELAYLHPENFIPDYSIVKKINPSCKKYFVLRLVSLKAYHDVGKKGIDDEKVGQLISLLNEYGNIFISSERELPEKFEKYRMTINPEDIKHILYYADMYIGDSQTMASEASILGVPTFRINDFVGRINVMEEKEVKYELMKNYRTSQFDKLLKDVSFILENRISKESLIEKRDALLCDKINLSVFMLWLFENYPSSIEQYTNKQDELLIKYKKMRLTFIEHR